MKHKSNRDLDGAMRKAKERPTLLEGVASMSKCQCSLCQHTNRNEPVDVQGRNRISELPRYKRPATSKPCECDLCVKQTASPVIEGGLLCQR